ncbi:hypothetical protein B0H10DRAFT_2245117 [Mycena sp. CBHHK59/15]|nr:hypothetical protein B0H10DRAFT_2245117 [Mycena sp. CBHHK59/15]
MATPHDIEKVCAAAETYFQRDKFDHMLMGADQFGIEDIDESSDDESGSDSSDSEDESDKESHKRRIKKRKAHKLKKSLKYRDLASDRAVEKSIMKEGKTAEVEGMIRQLNTMSLEDPTYGSTLHLTLDFPHARSIMPLPSSRIKRQLPGNSPIKEQLLCKPRISQITHSLPDRRLRTQIIFPSDKEDTPVQEEVCWAPDPISDAMDVINPAT